VINGSKIFKYGLRVDFNVLANHTVIKKILKLLVVNLSWNLMQKVIND